MSMIKRATVDLWAGILICLAFVALIFTMCRAEVLSVGNPSATYRLEARFTDIGGLKETAPVRSAGVLVGRVERIRFDNQAYEAVVSLAIDERFSFPVDTSASILTSGVLGERYVNLDAGSDGGKLRPGGRITITSPAVVIEDLIGQFLFPDKEQREAPVRPSTR